MLFSFKADQTLNDSLGKPCSLVKTFPPECTYICMQYLPGAPIPYSYSYLLPDRPIHSPSFNENGFRNGLLPSENGRILGVEMPWNPTDTFNDCFHHGLCSGPCSIPDLWGPSCWYFTFTTLCSHCTCNLHSWVECTRKRLLLNGCLPRYDRVSLTFNLATQPANLLSNLCAPLLGRLRPAFYRALLTALTSPPA